MNELQIFNNPEFGEIRIIEMDGEPWFVGKDVAEILGYANPSKALSDHVDAEDKLNNESLSSLNLNLGQRGGWIINESGLYSLVLSSKLPSAKNPAVTSSATVGSAASCPLSPPWCRSASPWRPVCPTAERSKPRHWASAPALPAASRRLLSWLVIN
jgi:hypothetical protein